MSSCMYFPAGTTPAQKRERCAPQVYRYRYPEARMATSHVYPNNLQSCHELEIYPDDRLTCAAGNASILRGGKECFHTNMALAALIQAALSSAGLPPDAVQLVAGRCRATERGLIVAGPGPLSNRRLSGAVTMLAGMAHGAALWIVFGTSGYKTAPPGLVIENYTWRRITNFDVAWNNGITWGTPAQVRDDRLSR